MTEDKTRGLRGFALPAVIVASAIILLLILFAYSAITLNMRRHSLYHDKKQQRLDLESALALYCADSSLCDLGDSAEVELFAGHDAVSVSVKPLGLYETVTVSNGCPDEYIALVGRRYESDVNAALWVCDRNRALSIAGDTRIEGYLYMPLSGINYTEVNKRYYTGDPIPESLLGISSRELPAVDSAQLRYAGELCRRNCDKVELRGSARDTVVCGRTVKIKSGFRGSIQVFASDTVIVECGASLEYPSGIYVDSGEGQPFVALESGAKLSGYIIVTNSNTDNRMCYQSYVQEDGAVLEGLLYVEGSCNIEGDICGAVYIKDCCHCQGGNVYPGTLYDVRIVRGDSLAFPIFLKGPYRRKMIKKMH